MHFFVVAVVPPTEDLESTVAKVMGPCKEDLSVTPAKGFWDWYQIGGRWTGVFDDGYDPERDIENIESCKLCDGTGTRPNGRERFGAAWVENTNGCNGCDGRGVAVKWPTQWRFHPGDVVPTATAAAHERTPHALVTPDHVYESDWYDSEKKQIVEDTEFDEKYRKELATWPDHLAVVVDCHS